ncbi:helix-turn-helix domain-containing protein [Frateuria aurantia]|uniref:Factor for inversion stimulation Fis, transcriptional activator n=1 Tax=Frateuria aurantia (strain ATCC 33424 / DSM 6220 / KCTC 2777 / LMG 1558 / NBRC 3245 / NCIMB 13370) TaxID=767434 RepID=H8L216_FRAAD|nr:helix-turn-helix domain-containing protein [Frateuria aurantia]AFC87271.1 Factor for inversion stimulation Fis, transcriptional activator [Frateuria aurantia DSM 6220]
MPVNAASLPIVGAAETTLEPGLPQSALSEAVSRAARRYLSDIGDTPCAEGLYSLFIRELEAPLLREVLAWHDGNQSRAATALGINRATLRKKLSQYGLG